MYLLHVWLLPQIRRFILTLTDEHWLTQIWIRRIFLHHNFTFSFLLTALRIICRIRCESKTLNWFFLFRVFLRLGLYLYLVFFLSLRPFHCLSAKILWLQKLLILILLWILLSLSFFKSRSHAIDMSPKPLVLFRGCLGRMLLVGHWWWWKFWFGERKFLI